MNAIIKTGRKDGIISSYNLIFDNGLRLSTVDLTWETSEDRRAVLAKFYEVVDVLRAAGVSITGADNA